MTQNTCSTVKHRIGRNAVERFDESEVREIKIDDRDYPELLKGNKKTTESSPYIVEICHRIGKLLLFLEVEKQHKHTLDACVPNRQIARSIRVYNRHWTCPGVATLLLLKVPFQEAAQLSVSFRADSNPFRVIQKNLLRKSLLQEGQSFLNILTTTQRYSTGTFYDAMRLSLGLSEKTIIIAAEARSGSSATANRALSQGREVIITRHVAAKIEGRNDRLKILRTSKTHSVWIAKIRNNERRI